MQTIHFIDSHTGGEPTRLVVDGGPDLGSGPLSERLELFRSQHDLFRSAVVNEPRGSDALVGALLCPPVDRSCAAGVIFFNNVGYLGMCGHGAIGVVATLAWMGRLGAGLHRIETPVGTVTAELHDDGQITVGNVPAYRWIRGAAVDVPGHGDVHGDVAWGGNWFFLTYDHRFPLDLAHLEELTDYAWAIRAALREHGVEGAGGREIDHIELFSIPAPGEPARSFVLCPGKAYDRSPCGTGTSAKMACLWADGVLEPGQPYRQQSIVGSVFEGYVEERDGQLWPFIRGSAFVTAEGRLVLEESDPFRWGIRP
ncbi:MAG: proline racemase family protein [Bryobacteraceae bacterium]